MTRDRANFGNAIGAHLLRCHPVDTMKLVARDLGCTLRAAEIIDAVLGDDLVVAVLDR